MAVDAGPRLEVRLAPRDLARLRRRARLRRYAAAYGFVAPAFLLIAVVLVVPSGWVIWLSFHSGGILDSATWVGLDNWRTVFSDPVALQALRNTLVYLVVVTPLSLLAGLGLALALQQLIRGRSFFRAVLYFPTLTPYVVAALLWTFVVHPQFGVLNLALRAVALDSVNWLSEQWALMSVVMLEFWHGLGYWTVLFLAALVSLPEEVFEAAKVDGASRRARFWFITRPLLRPAFAFAVVVAVILNLQVFDPILVLTNGGPGNASISIAVYIYQQTFQFSNPGVGAAMSVVLLAIILAATVVLLRLLRSVR
jgi:multiple sugar transport system permease protein